MSAACLQTVSGLPAEVADDLFAAPGDDPSDTELDQNGWRGNLLARSNKNVGSTRHKKEGRTYSSVPCDAVVSHCLNLKLSKWSEYSDVVQLQGQG